MLGRPWRACSRLRRSTRTAVIGVLALSCFVGMAAAASLSITSKPFGATMVSVPPYSCTDMRSRDLPVSYWRLDESSGTTAADSTGGRSGTYTGGYTLGQNGALSALTNKAVAFDGSSGYVTLPYAAALNPATFTIEAWAKPTVVSGSNRAVVASYDDGTGGGALNGYWLGSDGTNWIFEVGNGTATMPKVTGGPALLGSWAHLVGTYDGSTLRLYVNGTLAGSVAGAFVVNSASPFQIGATYYRSTSSRADFFNGSVDDVSLSSSTLTATQVRAHYNAERCYRDEVLLDGPTAYWRLGETTGDSTARDAKNTYPGTYVSSPSRAQTGVLNQDPDTSVTFNGSTHRMSVPYSAALNPAQLTVEVWAKPTGGTGTFRGAVTSLLDNGAGTVKGFSLGIDNTNRWGLGLGNGTTYTGTLGATATLNTWTHVVGTYDGTTARVYVNGLLTGSGSAGYVANVTQPFVIGALPYLGLWVYQFPGSIDEVAVYPTVLSQARIQAHYLAGRAYRDSVLDSSPVSYWRLGEASGATSAADSKGSSAGTYTGSPSLGQPGALAGDADTAASFDGSSQYVAVPYSAALNPAPFTVEAWAKWNGGNPGTWRTVLGTWDNVTGNGGYWLGMHTGGAWYMSTQGSAASYSEILGPAAVSGAWVHLAATYDGTTLRFYVNGTEVGNVGNSTTPANYVAQSSVNLGIGANVYGGGPGDWFPGMIDDVAVYSTALSAAAVQLHYDSGRQ